MHLVMPLPAAVFTPVVLLIVGAAVVMLVLFARLWWVLRDRSRRRRALVWNRRWAAYRLRLPGVLMARWPKGRRLAHRSDLAG